MAAGISRDPNNAEEIVNAGAIQPLVGLLSGESSMGAKKHAANAIARLAACSYETQITIAKAGAINALASWFTLESLGPGMVELAARALSDIAADNPLTADGIVRADAIRPLIAMLGANKGNDAQKSAAGTLATLANVELPPLPVAKRSGKAKAEEQDSDGADLGENGEEEEVSMPIARFAPIAEQGGIPLLVELLKAERSGPHENATNAIWHLADTGDNKIEIAEVGGISALVQLLQVGSEATQQYAAAAMNSLARDCPENQLRLAKAKAIQPLVGLLGSDNMETQEFAVGALLCLASHVESRNAVIKRLVAVLDARNASAQMRAAAALAVLSSRNTTYRSAIMEAGAIPPLVRLLGDGLRVENDTPQERAACVLADLARSGESKEEIVEAGGIEPLVRMLGSSSSNAQSGAAAALMHLSSNGDNKIAIAQAGGIVRLVTLLSNDANPEGKAYAAACLRLLATSTENKVDIIQAGGIVHLVQMMKNEDTSPEAIESAAAVLSEIARTQQANKTAIVDAGGIEPLVKAAECGSPGAKKCSAATLWGLAQSSDYKLRITEAGAIAPLVGLLKQPGEAQSYAVATLSMLAEIGESRKQIFGCNGVEPLMEIAKSAAGAWLRGQAVEVLTCLGIKDPLASSGPSLGLSEHHSPRTPRAGAMSARNTKDKEDPKDAISESSLVAGDDPADVAEALMTIATGELMEVAGSKALQLRAKFELTSVKAGELPPGKAVSVMEQKMTEDGKTRMAVIAEGETSFLGWLTGSAADNKKNLKAVARPILQMIAAKPLVARASCDLTSDKAGDLAPDAYVHIVESKKMSDGAYRVSYALEGKDEIKGWVTAITKDGQNNLDIVPGRRPPGTAQASTEKAAKLNVEKTEQEEDAPGMLSQPLSPGKEAPSSKPQLTSRISKVADRDVQVEQAPLSRSDDQSAPSAQETQPASGRRKQMTSSAPSTARKEGSAGDLPSAGSRKKSVEAAAPAAPQTVEIFVVRTKLKMRGGCELDSEEAGDVRGGTRVKIIERGQLSDGTLRGRLASESDSTTLGWVSILAKDGQANLVETSAWEGGASVTVPAPIVGASGAALLPSVQQTKSSNGALSSSKIPPLAQGSIGMSCKGMQSLTMPSASGAGLPTARSAAKAASVAGAAKAALPAAAVAAAAAAARESVMAEAAAVQAAATAGRSARLTPVSGSAAAAPAIVAAQAAVEKGKMSPRASPKGSGSPRASSPRVSSPRSAGRASPTPKTPGRSSGTSGRFKMNQRTISHSSQSR